MWNLGTYFRANDVVLGLLLGLDNLEGLFQP